MFAHKSVPHPSSQRALAHMAKPYLSTLDFYREHKVQGEVQYGLPPH